MRTLQYEKLRGIIIGGLMSDKIISMYVQWWVVCPMLLFPVIVCIKRTVVVMSLMTTLSRLELLWSSNVSQQWWHWCKSEMHRDWRELWLLCRQTSNSEWTRRTGSDHSKNRPQEEQRVSTRIKGWKVTHLSFDKHSINCSLECFDAVRCMVGRAAGLFQYSIK